MARSKIDPEIKARGISFASRIKSERIERNLTQRKLSELSNVPLDTLRSIENGRILSPGVFVAADIVHALKGRLDSWIHSQPIDKKSKGKKK